MSDDLILRDALLRVGRKRRLTMHRCYAGYGALGAWPSVPVPSAAGTWGAWTELVPVNGITSDFYLIGFGGVASLAPGFDCRVALGIGAAGAEVGVGFGDTYSRDGQPVLFVLDRPPLIAANTRVAARATAASGALNINYSQIMYAHTGDVG